VEAGKDGTSNLSQRDELPGNSAQVAVLVFGVMSALTWALSVVGGLVWTGHLRVVGHVMWGGWFNFFAAAFAVLVLGYSITLSVF